MENEAGVAFTPTKNANGNVDQDSRPSYSIPGILHFIQHEWTRFEMDRAHWEVERAELQVGNYLIADSELICIFQHYFCKILCCTRHEAWFSS